VGRLKNVHVLVAGAGLAGLAAARALEADGASVDVIEARDRVGGRVWTIRDGFTAGQYGEGGADFVESTQTALVTLARDLRLRLVPTNRRGFGYYGVNARGRLAVQSMSAGFPPLAEKLAPLVYAYKLAERRWTSAIATSLARQSVASWLKSIKAPAWLAQRMRGFRGLFLADPEDLSLLALVDFFADMDEAGWGHASRIAGGNDGIATALAKRLKTRVKLGTALQRIRQTDGGIVATVEERSTHAEIAADYAIVTLPAIPARAVVFEPGLPSIQQDALTHLRYGAATRLLLQFSRRFWNQPGRPTAFGSDQPLGALWDGNEHQKGPAASLSFLAGGGASRELQEILRAEGTDGVVKRLRWLGRPSSVIGSRTITWEDDPWARGGYAAFDSAFKPEWRDALAWPHRRVMFAGEHTSLRWQGYMNGAVESGQRAAAEIAAVRLK
jgi:monoamine oxidase